MSIARKAAHAAMWNQIGKIFNYVIFFFSGIFIARRLGTSHYGIYAVLLSIQTTVSSISALGLEQVLFNFIPKCRGNIQTEKNLVLRIIAIRFSLLIIVGMFLWVMAGYIANYFNTPQLSYYLRIFIPFILLNSIMSIMKSYQVSKMRTRIVTSVTTLAGALQVTAILLFVKGETHGLLLLLYIFIAVSVLLAAVFAFMMRPFPVRKKIPFTVPVLLDFGISIWLIGIMNYLLGKHFSVMLMGYFNIPVKEIGYFSLATGFALTVSTMLLMGTSELTLSIFSELKAGNMEKELKAAWSALVILGTVLIIPPGTFMLLYAEGVITLLYGAEYAPAGPYLVWAILFLMISRLLGGGNNLTLLYAMQKHKTVLLLRTVTSLLNAVCTYISIQFYGVTGAIIVTGVATVATIAAEWYIAHRHCRISFPFGIQFKIITASLAGGIASYLLYRYMIIPVVPTGICFGTVFFLVLYLVKPFDKTQLGFIESINSRLGRFLWHFSHGT